jgi:hypothetical protein
LCKVSTSELYITVTKIAALVLSKEEKTELRIAVKKLEPELQSALLQMALKWNANTRNCACGQVRLIS